MRLKAIVFDLDGTLLNTLEDLADATNWALRKNGMPERALAIERAVPDGEENPLFEQTFEDFKRYYVVHCQDKTSLYDGVGEMLRALKERGFKLAIVSNKLQAGVDELYDRYFRDTVAVAIGERPEIQRKPAPDMVELALRALGVAKEEAVYVGDSDVDLQTARNSGLPCISVLWGFRDRAFLEAHGATCFTATPDEVVQKLMG